MNKSCCNVRSSQGRAILHRTGRTGRAGRTGIAVTFVDWEDLARWSHIDKALELNTPDPIETYSSSPHLFTDLDIPAGTKGRIAATKRPSDWKPGDHEKPKGQRGGLRAVDQSLLESLGVILPSLRVQHHRLRRLRAIVRQETELEPERPANSSQNSWFKVGLVPFPNSSIFFSISTDVV